MIPYIRISQLHIDSIPDSSINLIMSKGDIVGITGRNGSGKTTFARYLAGQERPDKMGSILINGLDPFSQLDREKLRSISGLVTQNPGEGMVLDNVGRDIAFGAENQGIPKEKTMKRTGFYLKKYSLWKKKNSPVSSLSASEKQRAALSSILIMHPEILIIDESFSMMSNIDIEKYLNIVINSARKRNETVIIFSKKYNVLKMTDIQYELADGGLREIDIEGSEYFSKYISEGIILNGAKDTDIVKKSNDRLKVERYIHGNNSKDSVGISLHNVTHRMNNVKILDRTNMRFVSGSAYRIVGKHSSGKTTYLKLAAGLIKPQEGEIFRSDDTKIGYVFQYPDEGFVETNVLDEVMFGPMSDGHTKRDARSMAESVLDFVGVDKNIWNRKISELSFGEKKKVAIAAAIALNPDFLFMDEPYAGLDTDSRRQIELIIEGLCREGKCIITVEA